MMRHIFLIFLLVLSLGCDGPVPSGTESGDIDTSLEPDQSQCRSEEPFVLETGDGSFKVKPVAEYRASVMVVGRESYSYGWNAKISSIDLAVVWGKLAEPEADGYITYSQSGRWYFYEYSPKSPFDNAYIIRHSSNNHIIPASENVLKAVKSIKKRDKVVIEGLLVNISGTYEGRNVWWNSSLSRADTGDGSCELVYVRKVRIGGNVYQ